MLSQIQLRSFRSFSEFDLQIECPILLIEGINGSGKTSLLEALYYACYLRSFRTHLQKELVHFASDTFFIKLLLSTHEESHSIQVGFSSSKRIVRVDDKAINSYKQLMGLYRVVSITEDDLQLIQGAPEIRRTFLDQALLLADPDYMQILKKLRSVIDNRNSLLRSHGGNSDLLRVWTEQLVLISSEVQQKRIEFLERLSREINSLLTIHFDQTLEILFSYRKKNMGDDQKSDNFWSRIKDLFSEEIRMGRSLFGAHLDDFEIVFQGRNSRIFASRGQQKLLLVLIKLAQIHLMLKNNESALVLVDDFMTDFDEGRARVLCRLLVATGNQLIFTSPTIQSTIRGFLAEYHPQLLKLTG